MRTTMLTLLAVLAVGAAAPGMSTQNARSNELAEKAQILAARQLWTEAVSAYEVAIAAHPDDAVLHNRLGVCYERVGETTKARTAFRRAVELRQGFADAYNNLGALEHARGRYQEAIEAYEQAIANKPQEALFFKNLGAAWLARGHLDKALEAWDEAAQLDPAVFGASAAEVATADLDLARQYFLFAKLLAAHGRIDEALELLTKARAAGFRDFQKLERDRDFTAVIGDPRYAALR